MGVYWWVFPLGEGGLTSLCVMVCVQVVSFVLRSNLLEVTRVVSLVSAVLWLWTSLSGLRRALLVRVL